MLAVNNSNNVNFQAKLDLSKVKGSKQRWQNIAKIFEEKTANTPNSKLILDGSFSSGIDVYHGKHMDDELAYILGGRKFKKLPDIAIAEKFKKLLQMSDKENALYENGYRLEKELGDMRFNSRMGEIWDRLVLLASTAKDKIINGDRLFERINTPVKNNGPIRVW